MGDRSVGKTSIIRTFIEGKGQIAPVPTNVMDDFYKIIEVNVDGKKHKVKLNIWDAAGDANVHNLAHLFVREIQIGVLVYSINSLRSYENLEEWI